MSEKEKSSEKLEEEIEYWKIERDKHEQNMVECDLEIERLKKGGFEI